MGKQKSYKGKKQYAVYKTEDRQAKNKRAKLAKHMKAHPNDAQAVEAKKAGLAGYKKKSETKMTSIQHEKNQANKLTRTVQNILATDPGRYDPVKERK